MKPEAYWRTDIGEAVHRAQKPGDAHPKKDPSSSHTDDHREFEAMIVAMIRSQVLDPAAQDQAITMALDRAGHIRSAAELEQIVLTLKQTDANSSREGWGNGDAGGHYRDDGTFVDERGYSSSSYAGETDYMASSHNIFYNANGQLKSYQEGWNGWARTYGTGYFAGTQAKSGDVYNAAYKGNEYYGTDPERRRAFTALLGSAKIAGAEYRPGDTMTAYEAKQCIDKVPDEKLRLIGKDEHALKDIVDDCRKDGEQKRYMTPQQDKKAHAIQDKGVADLDEALMAGKPTTPANHSTPSQQTPKP
ncbi:hypothetical protein [Hyphomicrobium sp.]|uniref:hypothetical protein n=1 Tax=Hyphomicrobium sp. TaxID=82 RepID=UPI003568EEC6